MCSEDIFRNFGIYFNSYTLLLIVIVICGIITGAFTATEGSVVVVVYSLVLSILYKIVKFINIVVILKGSTETTGIIVTDRMNET